MGNFKEYWKQHIFGHFGVSFTSGFLTWYNSASGLLFVGQLARQAMGYWEKRDTVSIDTAWLIVGFTTGLIVGSVARMLS